MYVLIEIWRTFGVINRSYGNVMLRCSCGLAIVSLASKEREFVVNLARAKVGRLKRG